jgi:hypothetical protein
MLVYIKTAEEFNPKTQEIYKRRLKKKEKIEQGDLKSFCLCVFEIFFFFGV